MTNNEMLSWLNYFWSRDIEVLKKEIRLVIFNLDVIDQDSEKKGLLEIYDQEIDKNFDVNRLFEITESTESDYREIQILEKSVKYFSERERSYQSIENKLFNFLIARQVYGAKPIFLKPFEYNWKPIHVVNEFNKIKICKEILLRKKSITSSYEEIQWKPLQLFLISLDKEKGISPKIDVNISAPEKQLNYPTERSDEELIQIILKTQYLQAQTSLGKKLEEQPLDSSKEIDNRFIKDQDIYDQAIEIMIKIVSERSQTNTTILKYNRKEFQSSKNKLATVHLLLSEYGVVGKIGNYRDKLTEFSYNEAARIIYEIFQMPMPSNVNSKGDIGDFLLKIDPYSKPLLKFKDNFKRELGMILR